MWEVPLTQGKCAFIDECDVLLVRGFLWSAVRFGRVWYATRSTNSRGGFLMHKEILGIVGDLDVDHRDRDGLNNRRENLRVATRSQNNANAAKRFRATSSRFKGVYWHRGARKWQAHINAEGERVHLGLYLDEEQAALAYDKAAKELFGEFARLNLPNVEWKDPSR